jgi:uncharacterized protein (TIGR04255 family)
VPLPNAPLVRVIAQVRFPTILKVQKPDEISVFQEQIGSTYPILRPEQVQELAVGPRGVASEARQTVWRFSDQAGVWRVTLAQDFVAVETTKYDSRSAFLDRLETVVRALEATLRPAQVQRLGVRYIDRIEGDAVDEIAGLVRKEMLGVLATPLSGNMLHSIGDTILSLPDGPERLRMRWGRLPPKAVLDPAAIEPIEAPSWILDLDMFSTEARPFSSEAIVADARMYAERLYAMFRWAVTDKFLRRYGGKP